jgi:primosomal protein N' (replication factor Y)
VLLGSATPSIETWRAARRGRYRLLEMPSRIGGGALPQLHLLDVRGLRGESALAPQAQTAIAETLARGEQALSEAGSLLAPPAAGEEAWRE